MATTNKSKEKKEVMEIISKHIYEKRKELDLTMEELGNRVGVSKSTINKWEKGNIQAVNSVHIKKLADALYVSPAWLIGLENTPEQEVEDMANRILRSCDYVRLQTFIELSKLSDEDFEKFLDYYELFKKR